MPSRRLKVRWRAETERAAGSWSAPVRVLASNATRFKRTPKASVNILEVEDVEAPQGLQMVCEIEDQALEHLHTNAWMMLVPPGTLQDADMSRTCTNGSRTRKPPGRQRGDLGAQGSFLRHQKRRRTCCSNLEVLDPDFIDTVQRFTCAQIHETERRIGQAVPFYE